MRQERKEGGMKEEIDTGIKEGEEEGRRKEWRWRRDGRREKGSVVQYVLYTMAISVLKKRRQTAKGKKQYTHHISW